MAATSVLDPQRLAAVLALLPAEQRKSAVEGMDLLAKASHQLVSQLEVSHLEPSETGKDKE